MARDYKKRATGRRRARGGAPPWVWLGAGLLVGLFVALLVYLNGQPAAPGSVRKSVAVPPMKHHSQDARDVRKTSPEKIPGPAKPKFDFYSILPEQEVVVPDQDITGKPRQGVRQVQKPGKYLLQVGSFQQIKKADELKARLALIGLEASIQTVTIDGRKTWNRVRLGPYTDLGKLNTARSRLKDHHINAILLKVKS